MKALTERFKDWQRERRISRLARLVHEGIHGRDATAALHAFMAMRKEINARSINQVARMERKMGIHHA